MGSECWYIFALGFVAQFFFSARTIIQWYDSEKSKRVKSPSLFWAFSIIGSWIFCLYGWLRADFSIVLGQFISYFIYLWNLNLKGILKRIPLAFRVILAATPFVAAAFMLKDASAFSDSFFHNENVPVGLLIFGSAGQVIFTLRFVYQWFISYKRKESILPPTFWLISLAGSASIIAYGIFRSDPVLILGQSVGFVAYIRNLIIGHKESCK